MAALQFVPPWILKCTLAHNSLDLSQQCSDIYLHDAVICHWAIKLRLPLCYFTMMTLYIIAVCFWAFFPCSFHSFGSGDKNYSLQDLAFSTFRLTLRFARQFSFLLGKNKKQFFLSKEVYLLRRQISLALFHVGWNKRVRSERRKKLG
jgi:hypothetical protein